MRKNHCQECKPARLSIVVRIAAARKPEIMLEIVFPACQIAILIGLSCLLYQEEVIRVIPGKKGASQRPTTKRQTAKPAPLDGRRQLCGCEGWWSGDPYLVMAGMQMVAALQASMTVGRKMRGLALASQRLPGSWPMR